MTRTDFQLERGLADTQMAFETSQHCNFASFKHKLRVRYQIDQFSPSDELKRAR